MCHINKHRNSIGKDISLLIVLTVFVKALGFVKQAAISYSYGISSYMDSYLVVTGFVSELGLMFFASVAITIVTLYHEEQKNKETFNSFVSNVFIGMLLLSIVLIVFVDIFASPVARLLAPGFSEELIYDVVIKLRIISILFINICISNICISILNAEKEFLIAKSIGIIQSISIIIACVLFSEKMGISALYIGFSAYYIVENIVLLLRVKRFVSFKPHNPIKDPRIRKLLRLSVPLFISNAIVQINAMVDKAIASGLDEGSVSALSYGSFIFSTIHSIMIANITTVLFTYFSQFVAEKDEDTMLKKSQDSILLLLSIMIPLCLYCCINANSIVRLIYGRGTFDERAIISTASSFLGYSIGLIFLAMRDVYLQVIYAYQRMKDAMKNGIAGVFVNIFLSIVLSKQFGVFGIAIADSISYLVLAGMSYHSACLAMPTIKACVSLRDIRQLLSGAIIAAVAGILINQFMLRQQHYIIRLLFSAITVFGVYYLSMILLKNRSAEIITLKIKSFLALKGSKNSMFYSKYMKRLLDLIVGIIILLLTWWLMVIVALVIIFTDGLPVLFLQERIGQYGKPFRIYKFRTMVNNAESIGPKFTPKNDPRIITIGRFLRKTSLDELPQLFNILKGDMSIVGYRPGVYENYTEEDFRSEMFHVKPGITGYAQVNGRSGLTLNEKRSWELKYEKDISFLTDLKILVKTVAVVLKRSNSY